MGILLGTEKPMVRAMCGVQLKDRKISMGLMFMFSLKKTMDQLAMTNSVHCMVVLRRADGHIL